MIVLAVVSNEYVRLCDRCIKPNDLKMPRLWQSHMVMNQLQVIFHRFVVHFKLVSHYKYCSTPGC